MSSHRNCSRSSDDAPVPQRTATDATRRRRARGLRRANARSPSPQPDRGRGVGAGRRRAHACPSWPASLRQSLAAEGGTEVGDQESEELVRLALDNLDRAGLLVRGLPAINEPMSRRQMLVVAAALVPVVASIVAPTPAEAQTFFSSSPRLVVVRRRRPRRHRRRRRAIRALKPELAWVKNEFRRRQLSAISFQPSFIPKAESRRPKALRNS